MSNLVNDIGVSKQDNLIVDSNIPIQLKGVTLAANQGELKRGSVIGIITVSGLGKLTTKTSSDGSQTAKYILADDTTIGDEDVVVQCYESGKFNRFALTLGGSDEVSEHEDDLRKYGIFLADAINY